MSDVDTTLAATSRSGSSYADVVEDIGTKIDQLSAPSSSLHQAAACNKLALQGAVLSSLSESAQREVRKLNFIVFNMPEQNDNQSDGDRNINRPCCSIDVTSGVSYFGCSTTTLSIVFDGLFDVAELTVSRSILEIGDGDETILPFVI